MMKISDNALAPGKLGKIAPLLSVLLALLVTGCGAKQAKTTEQLEAEVEQADLILIVNRNLYVDTNVRNTFIQDGYAQKKRYTDKFDPYCRFSINYELAGNVDTTKIEAQRIAVRKIRRARNTASSSAVHIATTGELHARKTQINSWVTQLVLKSAKQPWITSLDCEIFASRNSYLSLDDIREVIDPSMTLDARQ